VARVTTSPIVLLGEARAAGFSVRAEEDRLIVKGPTIRRDLVDRILADKAGVLAALAEGAEAEIAWRVSVMAPQIPATGTIPVLVARRNAAGPADCLSCGNPMEAGQRYVCRACAEAARRVVAADEAERAARRSTGRRP